MLTASEDGTICIWQTADWVHLKTLLGHSGAVTSVAVHPSCRIALSCGRDRTLRTWDLIKGKQVYSQNTREGSYMTMSYALSNIDLSVAPSH